MSTQKTTYSSEREIAEIWKLFRENREQMREAREETDRQMRETDRKMREAREETDRQMRETDRKIRESREKTDRQMRETDKKINKISGDFDRKWGRLVESLVEGGLIKLLNQRGIEVIETAERVRGVRNVKDKYGKVYPGRCEIDILAKNGKDEVAVEVKSTLKAKDVDVFLHKLESFTHFFPSHKNNKIYGAMAYLTVDQNADEYAKKQGLFAIKATGDSARITNTKSFKPKVFPTRKK